MDSSPATRPAQSPPRPQPKAEPPPPASPRGAADELDVLIRARYPIIYVVTSEEERVEQELARIVAQRNKKLFIWTCTQGIAKSGTDSLRVKSGITDTADPLTALDAVVSHVEPAIYLFKDFHPYMEENRSNLAIVRRLRDAAYHLRDTYKTIVIVAPVVRVAPDLDKDVTVLEYPPPDTVELGRLLDRIVEDVKDNPQVTISLNADGRERLVQAARGLTLKEAENVFAKTLVVYGRIVAEVVSIVFSEKQQIIKKSGLLEY